MKTWTRVPGGISAMVGLYAIVGGLVAPERVYFSTEDGEPTKPLVTICCGVMFLAVGAWLLGAIVFTLFGVLATGLALSGASASGELSYLAFRLPTPQALQRVATGVVGLLFDVVALLAWREVLRPTG